MTRVLKAKNEREAKGTGRPICTLGEKETWKSNGRANTSTTHVVGFWVLTAVPSLSWSAVR
jgi:hypothetical protein